jgi:F0F1-type ATP synthase assembly protein I
LKKNDGENGNGKDNGDREIRKALSLLTQLGFAMAACVIAGAFAGKWLDRWLGTSPWILLAGCFLGGAAAFKVLYDMVIKEWL